MVSFEGVWSRTEAETFLDAALVPARIGCHNARGGLWMLSLWYRYRNGRIECATSKDADFVSFLHNDEEVCFEISTNQPPYMGIRGSGTATVEPDDGKALLRSLIERYLGSTDGEMASLLLREDREEVAISIEPTRLYTWDFTPRMADVADASPARTRGEPSSPKYD